MLEVQEGQEWKSKLDVEELEKQIASVKSRKAETDKARLKAQAARETAEEELAEIREQLANTFGVTSVEEISALLDKKEKEINELLKKAKEHLDNA